MSWIDDEANENFKREVAEENRERQIATSNYWEKLVRQVESDVNELNAHTYWKTRMPGSPLIFGANPNGPGYRVSKPGFPGVIVSFFQDADGITVKRNFYEHNPVSQDAQFKATEPLEVAVSGDDVVLKSPSIRDALVVPEEASRYILRVVIESLKISKR